MKRRSFIKVSCLSPLAFLAGCNNPAIITAKVSAFNGSKLTIDLTAFNNNQHILVAHPLETYPILITKGNNGHFAAVLMKCTHQNCKTEFVSKKVICPCHGSTFEKSGRVIKGPAQKNLVKYKVTPNQGNISIELSS